MLLYIFRYYLLLGYLLFWYYIIIYYHKYNYNVITDILYILCIVLILFRISIYIQ